MNGAENATEGTQDVGQCIKRPPLGKKKSEGGGQKSVWTHVSGALEAEGVLSSSLGFLSDARGEELG